VISLHSVEIDVALSLRERKAYSHPLVNIPMLVGILLSSRGARGLHAPIWRPGHVPQFPPCAGFGPCSSLRPVFRSGNRSWISWKIRCPKAPSPGLAPSDCVVRKIPFLAFTPDGSKLVSLFSFGTKGGLAGVGREVGERTVPMGYAARPRETFSSRGWQSPAMAACSLWAVSIIRVPRLELASGKEVMHCQGAPVTRAGLAFAPDGKNACRRDFQLGKSLRQPIGGNCLSPVPGGGGNSRSRGVFPRWQDRGRRRLTKNRIGSRFAFSAWTRPPARNNPGIPSILHGSWQRPFSRMAVT